MKLQSLKNKKVLILGFAREGKDVLRFLRKRFPSKVFGIADQKESLPNLPKRVKLHLGKNYLKAIKEYDVVVKSPGIPLRIVKPYLKKRHLLTSETDLFFSECQGTIVGITGTKGKSTTASLIHSILKKGGKKAFLVGNIGEPSLRFLSKQTPGHIFVYELSSFQLEHLQQSPHVAVLLNVFSEHLNHHGSFAKYVSAKANIAKYQTEEDFLIYNAENKITKNIARISKAQKLPWFRQGAPWRNQGARRFLAPVQPAVLVGRLFGIPGSKIKQAIKGFEPLPHRLERIGTFKGISFINDSLATIPEATCAALDILGDNAATLIAGGYDRGVDMRKLARRIEKSKVQTLILFPDTGKKILRALRIRSRGNFLVRDRLRRHRSQRNYPPKAKQLAFGPKNVFFAEKMNEAVKISYLNTPKGKVCLLSPAASSFNLFKDYADRGNQFKKFVKEYGR